MSRLNSIYIYIYISCNSIAQSLCFILIAFLRGTTIPYQPAKVVLPFFLSNCYSHFLSTAQYCSTTVALINTHLRTAISSLRLISNSYLFSLIALQQIKTAFSILQTSSAALALCANTCIRVGFMQYCSK